jgi:hypothetical protein
MLINSIKRMKGMPQKLNKKKLIKKTSEVLAELDKTPHFFRIMKVNLDFSARKATA